METVDSRLPTVPTALLLQREPLNPIYTLDGTLTYEVFNALTVASRLRTPRLTQDDAIQAMEEFLRLAIPTVTDDALLRSARTVAYRYGCAFYDGLYLALAERLNIRLVTADRKLYNLVSSHRLALWITDYPRP